MYSASYAFVFISNFFDAVSYKVEAILKRNFAFHCFSNILFVHKEDDENVSSDMINKKKIVLKLTLLNWSFRLKKSICII